MLTPAIRPGLLLGLLLLTPGLPGGQAPPEPGVFDRDFRDKTMRLDYFHTGTATLEVFSLDRVVSDGPWPGSREHLIDTLEFGKYFFEVQEPGTGRILYSRGFASLYGEWETTPEARQVYRTFHESLRFPWPTNPVRVVLKKRIEGGGFDRIWSVDVDPDSRFVNPADRPAAGTVWPLFEHGPAADKVDLLIISEGYTESEMEKFHADARRLTTALFDLEPFRSRKADFNVRALDLPSPASGVHRPRAGAFRRTPISAEFNIFDSERYVLTHDNRALRDAASSAPYEFLEILVNERQYGGGGIYNFQATASVDSAYSPYVFIHEFGHHFAALADEYYTSDVAYETGREQLPEPWEPNITALHDPAALKWGDLVDPQTPLPTPWPKEEFERRSHASQEERRRLRAAGAPESELDALFRAEEDWSMALLQSAEYAGRVGAFEGAGYEATGLYRPEIDCIMFTRDPVGFCRVCQRTISRVIDLHAGGPR